MLWFTAGCSGAFCDCDDITRMSSLAVQELSAWLVLQYRRQRLQYVKNFDYGYLKSSMAYAGIAGIPSLSSHLQRLQWVGDTCILISSPASFQLSPAQMQFDIVVHCYGRRAYCQYGTIEKKLQYRQDYPTSIVSNFFDSHWDFSTTFRQRRNLFLRFWLHIFRRRVGKFQLLLYMMFFFSSKFVSVFLQVRFP